MKGMTDKVQILHRGQSDPALQKTSNNFFISRPPSWCKYLPNIYTYHLTPPKYLIHIPPLANLNFNPFNIALHSLKGFSQTESLTWTDFQREFSFTANMMMRQWTLT